MFGHVLRSSASVESRIHTITGRLLIQAESLWDLGIFDLGWSYHHWWNKLNFYYRRDENIERYESQNATSAVLKKRQSRFADSFTRIGFEYTSCERSCDLKRSCQNDVGLLGFLALRLVDASALKLGLFDLDDLWLPKGYARMELDSKL